MGKLIKNPWAGSRPGGVKLARNPLRAGRAPSPSPPQPSPAPRPTVPRELAGKWVAWSPAGDRIIASGDTLAEVRAQAAKVAPGRPSFEKVPALAPR